MIVREEESIDFDVISSIALARGLDSRRSDHADRTGLGEIMRSRQPAAQNRRPLRPKLPVRIGAPALAVLLEQARKKTMRVWAEQSPFNLKDALKRRGYRWSDGSDGRPRSWYIEVGEDQLEDEIAFLKTEIYLSEVEPRLQTLTALSRFSVRA
jgi:hypothetical protein